MNRTDWSLTNAALDAIISIINREGLRRVIEFGSGYSTYRLARDTTANVISFEHQERYYREVLTAIQGLGTCDRVGVYLSQLYKDGNITRPLEHYKTGQSDPGYVFYSIPLVYSKSAGRGIDCIVLDGPNGSGRSIAFDALKSAIKFPCYVLIDDCQDYDFVGDMRKTFADECLDQRQEQNKAWSIHKITGYANA